MEKLIADLRFGAKLLLKDRGFAAAALITLALCIGANTAIFSIVHSVLLKPLPFKEPHRIVKLYNSYVNAGVEYGSNSVPDYYDRQELAAFQDVAMYQTRGVTIGEAGSPERVFALAVTPSFFRLLGVAPERGRWLDDSEGEPGGNRAVLISYGLWQEQFAGSDAAIGSDLRIDGERYSIVGVMPRNFVFGDGQARIFVPLVFTAALRADDRRHNNSWEMLARLSPGTTVAQAKAQVDALNRAIEDRFPQLRELLRSAGYETRVVDYHENLVSDIGSTLYLLQAGVLLVLLMGCVNIANLLLVRSTARHRELATRAALGADRRRLVRQMATESVLLALVGGALGLLLGYAAVRVFAATAAEVIPRGAEVGMDWPVIVASVGLSLAAGLLFGTIPVVRVLRADLSSVFREEGRTGTASRSALAVRGALVVAQVAIAFALLMGAALMVTSFVRTLGIDTGFEEENVLTASVALPVTKYPNDTLRAAMTRQLVEKVRAIPGVVHAGVTNTLPFSGSMNSSAMEPEGYVRQPGESLLSPVNSVVSPGYLEAMGIELVRGRTFNEGDTESSLPVVVIDEWLAQRYWPNEDPIGKRLARGVRGIGEDDQLIWRTIVGVVKPVRMSGYRGDQPNGHYYFPVAQDAASTLYLAIRTSVDPLSITTALRAAVLSLDADMPVFGVQTMNERTADSLATDRLRLVLLVSFAALALLLAAVGIYGVLAYTVAQRSAELGIRMALGSSTGGIFRLVLGQGLKLAGIGLAVGLPGSLLLSRLLQNMLYQVKPNDPVLIAAVLVVLGTIAVIACVVPSRRATRIDPGLAMRV